MEKQLKRNLSYQTAYQMLQVLTPLLVTPYISRVLGSDSIGEYSYAYSVAYYFVMFAMLGVTNYGNRSIAAVSDSRLERSRVFSEIYSLQMLTSVIAIGAYFVFLVTATPGKIAEIQVFYVLTSIFDISWLFFGVEDVKPVVIKNTIIKFLSLIGVFSLVKKKSDLWVYTVLLAGGQFIGCISMWLSTKRYVDFVFPRAKDVLTHLMPNFKLFIPVIAVSVYKTLDKIMLGSMSTSAQVGFYTNSETLINAPLSFVLAVGTVMMPRITNLLANKRIEESVQLFRKSLRITMCFSCAAAFGIIAVAPTFVPFYYGNGYFPCVSLIQGQAIVLLFLTWANVVRTQYLLPHKHDGQYTISIISGAILNVTCNCILIPRYGARGALLATVLAECCVCVIQSIDANKYISMWKCIKDNIQFVLSGALMFIVVRITTNTNDTELVMLIKQIAIGAVTYCILVAAALFIQVKSGNLKGE